MVMVNVGLDWRRYFAAQLLLDVIMKFIGSYYADFADRYIAERYYSASGKQPKNTA